MDDLKLNGVAVKTTIYAIVDSVAKLLAGPSEDIARSRESWSATLLSSQEYAVDCTCRRRYRLRAQWILSSDFVSVLSLLSAHSVPLHDWRAEFKFQEGTKIFVMTMEAWCDLLQPHLFPVV